MQMSILFKIALVGASAVATMAVPGLTRANVTDPVTCKENPDAPQCQVSVTLPGRGGGSKGGGGGGSEGCTLPNGKKAPCHVEGRGFLGSDGCYYEPSRYTRQGPHGQVPPASGPGRWYFRNGDSQWCEGGGWWVWIPNGPGLTPRQLAQHAVRRLSLPSPQLRLNPKPPARQLVHLPTWMWVARSGWTARSATASVPGLSVTATARPRKISISTGDGEAVTCRGPGTVWREGRDPDAPSPTCGHTYRRAGSFTVTATVTWGVSWSGGGQSGTVPALTTTSTRVVRVTESQALN